jgi:aryl-alcohol dehydrogenase-like predicted oxidoreductase
MAAFCEEQGITLLTYGTVLGGLLSETWIIGRPEPGRADLTTASLQKYKNMIDAWGGWPLFQALLAALKPIANKHGASIANIGTRYILDQSAVPGSSSARGSASPNTSRIMRASSTSRSTWRM